MTTPKAVLFRFIALATCVAILATSAPAVAQKAAAASARDAESERVAVTAALASFHDAGARADEEAYFAALAPDAVLLGTAPGERNDVEGLRRLLAPFFERGVGTRSIPRGTRVALLDARHAWFEHAIDKADFGTLRATGVARKDPDGWKIVRYDWSLPIANENVRTLATRIGQWRADSETSVPSSSAASPSPAADVDTDASSEGHADADGDAIRGAREVLERYYATARRADLDAHVGCLAPDAVVLGTDPSERWSPAELRELLEPYFSRGDGGRTTLGAVNVALSEDGKLAWYDGRVDWPGFDEMRATGILRRRDDGAWRILRHSVSFLVPNELSREAVAMGRPRGR